MPATSHAEQSVPYEWRAFELGEETIVAHSTDEPRPDAYRVTGTTRDVLRLCYADAAIYEGSIVEPFWDDDLAVVRLCHFYAGHTDRYRIPEWLDEPVVLLEELERADITEAIGQ